jgi:hypothetical protein
MANFYKEINNKIIMSLSNEFYDNFDFEIRKFSIKSRYKVIIEKYLNKILKLFNNNRTVNIFHTSYFSKNIEYFEFFYNLLNDDKSKQKYIEILAYKILGFTKVKLSLNNNNFWNMRKKSEIYKKSKSIPSNFRNGKLYLYELKKWVLI